MNRLAVREAVWPIAAAVLALLVYGLAAGQMGLAGPDEPRYAFIGRGMAESGNWIDPILGGQFWFEKPALTYWLIGAGHALGLRGEAAARWPIALWSAIFLWLFARETRRLFDGTVAFGATAILCTMAGWVAFSSVAVTDLPMSAAVALALLFAMDGGRARTGWAGFCLGLAILGKGLVPVVLFAPVVLLEWKRWRDWLLMGAIAVATSLPWYAPMLARHGWGFFDDFFLRHHFSRFGDDALQHVQPWWFYLPVLLVGLLPWAPLLVALPRAAEWRGRWAVVWAWAGWGLLFFSLSRNKLPGYLLPLLPAAALLLASGWARSPRLALPLNLAVMMLGLVPAASAMLPLALAGGLSRAGLPPVEWEYFALFSVPAVAIYFVEQKGWRRTALALVTACAMASFGFLKLSSYPVMDHLATARVLSRRISAPDETCVGNLHRALQYGLLYYLRTELPMCESEPRRWELWQTGPGAVEINPAATTAPPAPAPVPAPPPASPASKPRAKDP